MSKTPKIKSIKKSNKSWWNNGYEGAIYQHPCGEIVCADALHVLNALKDKSADIVFLDPPFNLGKKYGKNGSHGDLKKETEYLAYMEEVLIRSAQVLKPGGALYLYHIPKWAIRLSPFLEQNLSFRHWIAISMKNGFVRGNRLYPAHYALLYYTKGDPAVFSRPKVPRPICARCKKDLRDYGGYKAYVANGINLSDVWDDVSPVRHHHTKNRVANELPLIIPERIIALSGVPEGLIVDPFAGSGTTLVASLDARMHFVAADCEVEYCRLMRDRIARKDK
jgi:site-specific DNA-methyltransferase (adenine-specific)